jgi:hypothetical protein
MLVAAKLGFACARTVIDAGSKKLVLAGQSQTSILYPRGTDRNARTKSCPIVEVDNTFERRKLATDAGAVNEDLSTELCGLLARPLGKFAAADPFGETEIVLDSGTGTGLPRARLRLQTILPRTQ